MGFLKKNEDSMERIVQAVEALQLSVKRLILLMAFLGGLISYYLFCIRHHID